MDKSGQLTLVDSYYEALEFFYWEPQHLGRKKHPTTKLASTASVAKHLRQMEVTLNHNLHQFFMLAPDSLTDAVFGSAFPGKCGGPLVLHGRDVDAAFSLKNSVQPDLLFTAHKRAIYVEMKINAKCSVRQVLKYALLGLAVELRTHRSMTHHLLLIGDGDLCRQWKESFTSLEEVKDALGTTDVGGFMRRQPAQFGMHIERYAAIVSELELAYMDYCQLCTTLCMALPGDTNVSDGAQVYRKLLRGVIGELQLRQLVTGV